MYICICRGITDSQIKEAICEGACRMRDLRSRLGVATQCGRCCQCCMQMLREHNGRCSDCPEAAAEGQDPGRDDDASPLERLA